MESPDEAILITYECLTSASVPTSTVETYHA